VFYSTKSHSTVPGNATNWNDNGYWEEVYPPEGKVMVTFLTKRFWGDKEKFHWTMKKWNKISQKPFDI
jgi:hypothetical protein